MRPYLQIAFLVLFASIGDNLFGQRHILYDIEKKLMKGDKYALKEIAGYFNSNKSLIEYLGYHRIETDEKTVAKRIVNENCLFTDSEIIIDEKTTKSDFLNFLNKNLNEITFSDLADAFLITPLDKRPVKVEFRGVTDNRSKDLQNAKSEILSNARMNSLEIDEMIQNKDPKCLLLISSELFKIRYRFNIYHFYKYEYLDLLTLLTNIEIGVEDERKEISWHIEKDFYSESSLNLLIYFASNYKAFKWDEQKGVFVNPEIQIKKADKEAELFQLLNNKNDTIALNAFLELTKCDPVRVIQLANEYQNADLEHNFVLGTFPYRFLKQIVQLVQVFKQEGINYYSNVEVKQLIDNLRTNLSFEERRIAEDHAIDQLSLNDISSLEYWTLLNERSGNVIHSVGRILDIYYSKHFNEILNDSKQLHLYLKKSYLFDNLGIIGVCNNYLVKFTNLQEFGISKLNLIVTTDNDVTIQIGKAKVICAQSLENPKDINKHNAANKDHNVNRVSQNIADIGYIKKQDEMEESMVEFLSKISYDQIGEALNALEDIEFKEFTWKKYYFLEYDFGFFIYKNLNNATTRQVFLNDYKRFSEYEFYKNMLSKSGTNYFNGDSSLNLDKVYDALKFNIVEAFVGGGGSKQDNEVYAIIKLLELTYKTTLGYPKKFCNSNGVYACNSIQRANHWMQYLIDNHLLKEEHNEPVSFRYH